MLLDFDKIMSSHKFFNQTVYTALPEAVKILEARQKDKELKEKVEKLLSGDIPEFFRKIGKYGVSERQVATPNSDTRQFIKLTKNNGLTAVFSEYLEDKFTSNNEFKLSLGRLDIHRNSKRGNEINEKLTIVDFNKNDGKRIKDVLTFWGQPLVDFHKKLFKFYGFSLNDFIFYDASDWLRRNGQTAKFYYKNDLLLYVCHGILFENFLLSGNEGRFTKNIFLPAFEYVIKSTGQKPLIVPVSPIDKENDVASFSYDKKIN
jgi:hypothetical protein